MRVFSFSALVLALIGIGVTSAVIEYSKSKEERNLNIKELGEMVDEISGIYSSGLNINMIESEATKAAVNYSDFAKVEASTLGASLTLNISLLDYKDYACNPDIMLSHILLPEAGVIVLQSGNKKLDFDYSRSSEGWVSSTEDYCGEDQMMPKGTEIYYIFNSRSYSSFS